VKEVGKPDAYVLRLTNSDDFEFEQFRIRTISNSNNFEFEQF
jgi:hypothetical protein